MSTLNPSTATVPLPIPELIVSRETTPEIFEHIVQATGRGHPTLLTYYPVPKKFYPGAVIAENPNRHQALLHNLIEDGGVKCGNDESRDEYPFACTLEGGTDSSVAAVPAHEQSVQGGQLAAFIHKHQLKVGQQFRVRGNPDLFNHEDEGV